MENIIVRIAPIARSKNATGEWRFFPIMGENGVLAAAFHSSKLGVDILLDINWPSMDREEAGYSVISSSIRNVRCLAYDMYV